jgi:hypothetical protein
VPVVGAVFSLPLDQPFGHSPGLCIAITDMLFSRV